jgi:RNA polymerase sigma-70 factor (ECF subfamily)
MAGGGHGSDSTPEGEGLGTPDELLARRVQAGEREAFAELARRYLRPIHAVVGSFLSEPADVEDASQETFLRALEAIAGFDADRPFAPWLYQIARNVARNRLDHRRRWRTEDAGDDLASASANPGVSVERTEIRSLVDGVLARMPDKRRTAFRLFDIEGYTSAETARLMGISEGTVRSHVHHARRTLRSELEPLMGGDEGR